MTDLYAGQKLNVVPTTEHEHHRPEVGEWDAIAVTIPEGMAVSPGQPVLIQGFFGFALQESKADSEDTIGIQMKPAEYEVGEDWINDSKDFGKGEEVYWDPSEKELTTSTKKWSGAITYSDTPATMIDNLETALDALGFEDQYEITESTEVYTITFDISVGETRLIADINDDDLDGSGTVEFEKTQTFDPDEGEEEVWELDIGNATSGDFKLGVEFLWVGKVSVEKDNDDVVWFLLAAFIASRNLEDSYEVTVTGG